MSTAHMGYVSKIDFSQRSSVQAAFVWGLAAFFYFYELMLLVSPSVMLDDLAITFQTSAEQLGSLAAYYYYAYALMQIPVGILMDRFGPRILLTVASLLCCLGCVIFGLAPTLLIAQIGRFVMGIGGSFAVVGCLKLASLWFPTNRFALLTGIMVSVGMMGGVFGQAPVAKLVMTFGWRDTTLMGAAMGAILSVIICFVISNHPFKANKIHMPISTFPFGKGLWLVMKNPQVWIASLYAGLMFVPTTGFGQLWGVPYFVERYQIEKDAAGMMVSMIFFGWAIGGPAFGWISDRILRRKGPMAVSAIASLFIMLMILNVPVAAFQMNILMFLLGAFSSGFIVAFSVVREISAPILTGTAIGFINTLNNLSGALAQPIIGRLLDKQWDGKLSANGDPIYSQAMYNDAFLFLPVCLLIALIVLPFVRETYCKQHQE